ncbi:MAG: hypothetical protein WC155_08465 [Candidatus Cloacimonadales bacterium]
MKISEIYKVLIEDLLDVSAEQIVVLSGLISEDGSKEITDTKIIEEFAVLIRQKGAFPVLDLATKSLKLRMLNETEAENYFIPKTYFSEWVKLINIIIDVSFPESRNLFTDNFFSTEKTAMVNESLQAIYKNMLIADKIVLLPNFPKTAIAEYYNIDLKVLENFYLGTFEPVVNKMNVQGIKIINHVFPNEDYFLQKSSSENILKIQISEQQSYFVGNKINNYYTVLPFGYVALSILKSSINGVFEAEKVYYKNEYRDSVIISFSFGNIQSIQCSGNDSFGEIIRNGLVNSKESVDLFIGVNNGVEACCNYHYYDRCINNNFSIVFYDEANNIIEISSKSVQLSNSNQKNILL